MSVIDKAKEWAKGRVEGYLIKKGVAKAVSGVVASALALWVSLQTNATFLKAQAILDWLKSNGVDIQITLDQAKIENALTIVFTGIALAAINFLFRDSKPAN